MEEIKKNFNPPKERFMCGKKGLKSCRNKISVDGTIITY